MKAAFRGCLLERLMLAMVDWRCFEAAAVIRCRPNNNLRELNKKHYYPPITSEYKIPYLMQLSSVLILESRSPHLKPPPHAGQCCCSLTTLSAKKGSETTTSYILESSPALSFLLPVLFHPASASLRLGTSLALLTSNHPHLQLYPPPLLISLPRLPPVMAL